MSVQPCKKFYFQRMFLACSLSGPCHYMLISSFKAKKNTRPVHWPGHQRFKPRYPPFSRDGSRFQKAVLIKSPLWQGNVPFKWPDSLPVDTSSARDRLALLCEDFMQFSHILWCVWGKCLCHAGGFWIFFFYASVSQRFYSVWCSWRDLVSWLWLWKVRWNVRLPTGNALDKGFRVKDPHKRVTFICERCGCMCEFQYPSLKRPQFQWVHGSLFT